MNVNNFLSREEKSYVQRQDFSEKTALQRLYDANQGVMKKEHNFAPISSEQKKEIEDYWYKKIQWHKSLFSMRFYDVYNAVEKDKSKLKYYIPDSFFYAFIDEYFTNPQRSTALDDKNLYDLYFADVKRPKTIARKINDVFMNEDYQPISAKDFLSICDENKEVVVKSAIGSYGGHGVRFWNSASDTYEQLLDFVYTNNCKRFKGSNVYHQYIIQEAIHQHPMLDRINSTSINTVRIMTLYENGKCTSLSSVLRMGIDGSRVDNCSSGGIVCGITEEGILKDVAYDGMANAYHCHPQGFEFAGVKIEGFGKCIELAKKLACRFYGVSRLISWDFAIDEDAEPVLIEMNISFGELDFHQLCNGPILGDDTDRILKDVVENNWTLQNIFDYMDSDE